MSSLTIVNVCNGYGASVTQVITQNGLQVTEVVTGNSGVQVFNNGNVIVNQAMPPGSVVITNDPSGAFVNGLPALPLSAVVPPPVIIPPPTLDPFGQLYPEQCHHAHDQDGYYPVQPIFPVYGQQPNMPAQEPTPGYVQQNQVSTPRSTSRPSQTSRSRYSEPDGSGAEHLSGVTYAGHAPGSGGEDGVQYGRHDSDSGLGSVRDDYNWANNTDSGRGTPQHGASHYYDSDGKAHNGPAPGTDLDAIPHD